MEGSKVRQTYIHPHNRRRVSLTLTLVKYWTTIHSLSSENNPDITTKPNMLAYQTTWSSREASIDPKTRRLKRQRDVIALTGGAVEATPARDRHKKACDEAVTSSRKPRATSTTTGEVIRVCLDEIRLIDTRATSTSSDEAIRAFLDELNLSERKENAKQWPDSYTQHLWSTSFPHNTSRADFEKKYVQEKWLGKGAFGCVFAGYRTSDHLPVAIKHIILKVVKTQEIVLNDKTHRIPREVLAMQRAAGGPESVGKSAVISLIDWFTLGWEVVLVLERPVHCQDLFTYSKECLGEQQAKDIMKQLVTAAIEINSKGVFHGDLKLDNILIETGSDVPRVRIIDFGLSYLVGEARFSTKSDYERQLTDHCNTITTCQLGWALLNILWTEECSDYHPYPDMIKETFIRKLDNLKVTRECKTFLWMLLNSEIKDDAFLENLRKHPWIN